MTTQFQQVDPSLNQVLPATKDSTPSLLTGGTGGADSVFLLTEDVLSSCLRQSLTGPGFGQGKV